MPTPGIPLPSRKRMFFRGATGRCAVCGTNRIPRNWFSMTPRCPQCNLALERKEGHFIGAVGMNTIVTFGVMGIALGIMIAIGGLTENPGRFSLILAIVGVVGSAIFFPFSKTLWSAIDLCMIDVEKGEVDPRWDPTVTIGEKGGLPRNRTWSSRSE